MSRFHWSRLFGLLLTVLLFALSILVTSGSSMRFYNEYVTQTSIIRGTNSITNASDCLIKGLSSASKSCAAKQYDILTDFIDTHDTASLSEKELTFYFRSGYYNKIAEFLGSDSESIAASIDALLKEAGIENVTVDPASGTCLTASRDSDNLIDQIELSDVVFRYSDPIIGERADTLSYIINIPEVFFFTGNDPIMDYCMVAGKGIYMTGATSTIIGDVYAGGHSRDEVRDSDRIFGEVGTYGGLNILSTQLGVSSDKLVCDGDINITGSFVIFSADKSSGISCYGHQLNKYDSFADESIYSIDGSFFSTALNDEAVLNDFYSYKNQALTALSKLDGIEIYYDSANVEGYGGPYRVLMSNSDIELTKDFTGILMTPCNVIIDPSVNVEGLIICGDRIYSRGNNNIVSNRQILREIFSYEAADDIGMQAIDYLGGIAIKGMTDPQYYVVPYK